jgi:hypothetical protein
LYISSRQHAGVSTKPNHSLQQQMEESNSKRGGRPPKESRDKKSFKIELKLTPADFDKLDKLYQNSGYRNKSDMYYDMVFNKSLKQKDSDTLFTLKEIQDLVREIKTIGGQYQQVVRTVDALTAAAPLPFELQKLVTLTEQLQEKEREMFGIIIKLREKWLRA